MLVECAGVLVQVSYLGKHDLQALSLALLDESLDISSSA